MNDFAITNNNHSNLDGLRAIGILLILTKHFFENFINLQICWVGIDLLFALSGLLITGILIETKEDSKYFQKFYVRRILRIFPLYYFVVIGFTIYVYFLSNSPESFNYFKNNIGYFYTYTQNWYFIKNGNPSGAYLNHTWSLAIDEQIYIFWPLFIWLCKTKKQLMYLCGGILIFSLCFRIGYNIYLSQHTPVNPYAYMYHTLCRIDSFGAGALLYCLLRFKHSFLTSKRMLYIGGTSLLLFLVFIFLDNSTDYTGYFMRNFGITVAGIHSTFWLYLGVKKNNKVVNFIFSSRVFIYLGKISYSLYVYHFLLLALLVSRIFQFLSEYLHIKSLLLSYIICLLITFIISILSYEYFEKPIIKIKRRFSYRKTYKNKFAG